MKDYGDVREQADRRDQARLDLKVALSELSVAAKNAARTLGVTPIYGAMSKVSRAEEALDIAQLDLDTARGADA